MNEMNPSILFSFKYIRHLNKEKNYREKEKGKECEVGRGEGI